MTSHMTCYDRDGTALPDRWFDNPKRPRMAVEQRVGRTIVGDVIVSTVWLMGIDHNWGDGPPLIFETMVFGDHDQDQRRYATEEQAMRGHLEAVDRLRAGLPPFDREDDR